MSTPVALPAKLTRADHTEAVRRPSPVRRELSIERVQRWVISILILAVAAFPIGALVASADSMLADGRRTDGIILLVVMAAIGVVALGAIRLVHRRSATSPWVVLGAVPAVIAALFVL